jgi:septal ring factor EnvC (AmiA/AmiB activator)
MITDLLESDPVPDQPRAAQPWFLVAASTLLIAVVLYVMFVGWLPAKQRVARLEAELKDVYAREAALQTRLAQQEQRSGLREQQANALRAERDALARRIEDLERELAAARQRRR